MMRGHFGDLGHRRQTDVSTGVRVDVFDHPGATFLSDMGPLSFTSLLNEDTVSRKDWSNVPALVNSSDLIGQKNRPTRNGGILFLPTFCVARRDQWPTLGFFLSMPLK
jgi:hypothetical protein